MLAADRLGGTPSATLTCFIESGCAQSTAYFAGMLYTITYKSGINYLPCLALRRPQSYIVNVQTNPKATSLPALRLARMLCQSELFCLVRYSYLSGLVARCFAALSSPTILGSFAMASHSRFHLNLCGQISRQTRRSEWSAEFVATPRRVRGHEGSPCLASYRECRELDLQATELLHKTDRAGAIRLHRDAKSNRIGFGGVSPHYLAQNRSDREPLPRAVTLRDVVARIDSSRSDSVSLAESVACRLNNLADGFGSKLLDCDNVEIAAKLAGISKSRAYRLLESVRTSWENFAVSAG